MTYHAHKAAASDRYESVTPYECYLAQAEGYAKKGDMTLALVALKITMQHANEGMNSRDTLRVKDVLTLIC